MRWATPSGAAGWLPSSPLYDTGDRELSPLWSHIRGSFMNVKAAGFHALPEAPRFALRLLLTMLLTTPAFAQQPTAPAPAAQPGADELARQRAAQEEKLHNDWADLHKYQDANSRLSTPAKKENRVVFMGNSITEGWAPHFATMFPGKPYIGRGISGQTTPQMLVRFQQDVVALKPKVVVILAGTNDIAGNTGPSTLEMIEDNIASMAEIAQANGIRVVLSSILPVYDYPWKPGLEPAPKIIAINAWLKRYVESVGETYLDYHSAMKDAHDGLPPELAKDGVHPTEAGYRIMARLVEQAIAEALR